MNKPPIEQANDADLRLSPSAMQRAAQRAWALALQTGTAIVVSDAGRIQHIHPTATALAQTHGVQEEPTLPYGERP
ncbi:MAG TPA: hypothetical protein PKN13_10830 [Accumulibacter sp.]|nr:hypothetical protein [Accumulibacter sp.]HMW18110.1 hypothetical protein [Accumulibacter sp.]HMX21930.1 hypothetical protein [Accumulibacter sp.]HMY07661.1 hypothetical protein [Accumulibacter sp.]HNC16897.1 hypothetical protein [Accumulibacter sp.]